MKPKSFSGRVNTKCKGPEVQQIWNIQGTENRQEQIECCTVRRKNSNMCRGQSAQALVNSLDYSKCNVKSR